VTGLSDRELRVCELLADLAGGITTAALYGDAHPRTDVAARRLIDRLGELLMDEEDKLQLVALGDELFVDGASFTRLARQAPALVRRLARCEVEHVTFRTGVVEAELREFLHDLAAGELRRLRSRPHILVGRVAVGTRDGVGLELEAGAPEQDKLPSFRDRVGVIHDGFEALAAGRGLLFTSFERVARALLRHLDEDPDPFAHLAPWEGVERWTAVHAHNTCVISEALARLAGLAPAACLEIGLAALLHDVGKAFEPLSLRERELAPTSTELELVPDHPRYGLEAILGAQQLPPIVPIVVYEHHLGYGGTGYPGLARPRRPHAATRLVAVADVLDTLYTSRLGRDLLGGDDVAGWIAASEGLGLDPDWGRAARMLLTISSYRLGK